MDEDDRDKLVVLDAGRVVPRRQGREPQYNERLAQEICEVVAGSDEALDVIFPRWRNRGWPSESTAYTWRMRHRAFREAFQIAQEVRAQRWMHQIVAIADDTSRDLIDIGEGRMIPNSAAVQRDRLRIDARERVAKRMDPRSWGDRRLIDEPTVPFTPLDDAIHLLD
jgi:hypothetical protein